MRLSPGGPLLKSKHLFPSSKLALLKSNSNEKLNSTVDIMSHLLDHDDCMKELPGLLLSKANELVQHWYSQTEDHRARLMAHLKKNWLRLVLSLLVLVAQFSWMTSSVIIGVAKTELCEVVDQKQSGATFDLFSVDYPSPTSTNQLLTSLPNNVDQDHSLKDRMTLIGGGYFEKSANSRSAGSNSRPPSGNSSFSNSPPSTSSFWSSWLAAAVWKLLLLCKLALILLCFELVRLSDTLVTVIRAIHEEEDEKARAPPKSPVDTGYIERNRGYK